MPSRRHLLAAALSLALGSAALAGWSAGPGNGAVRAEGTLVMVVPAVPDEMDPAKWSGLPHSDLSPATGGTLVRYRRPAAGSKALAGPADIEPELARSIVRGAHGYVVTLRDAKSPAGNTVSTADVKWSFDRMRKLDFIAQFLMSVGGIDAKNPVTVLDERRFRLNAPKPGPLTLAVLHRYDMGILDSTEARKHATAKDPWAQGWLGSHSASYGPYQIESLQPGTKLMLAANENYWRGAPHYTRVVVTAIPESSTRLQLLLKGSADYADFLGFQDFASIQNRKGVQAFGGIQQRRDVLVLNAAYEPFADARVRRAISLAVDRAAIVRAAYRGFARPAVWPQSSAIPQPRPPAADVTRHDPAQAKALLAQAGHADDLSFTLTVSPGWSGPQVQPLAELIQAQLRDVGVDVKIDVVASPAEFQKARTANKLQAFVDLENPVVVDVGYNVLLYYTTKGIQNVAGYSNPQLDALDRQLLAAFAPAKRDALIRRIDDILARDQPWVPLVEVINTVAFRTGICGFWANPERVVYIAQLTACKG